MPFENEQTRLKHNNRGTFKVITLTHCKKKKTDVALFLKDKVQFKARGITRGKDLDKS